MPLAARYDQSHFIEEFGLLFSQLGQPRILGRMLAWLLVCEPSHQSSAQLVQALRASKATVSTMSRELIKMGLAERVALPGDRKTYFRVKPGAFPLLVQAKLETIFHFTEAICRALAHAEAESPRSAGRLREVHGLYAFLERELPVLLRRWEEQREPPAQAQR